MQAQPTTENTDRQSVISPIDDNLQLECYGAGYAWLRPESRSLPRFASELITRIPLRGQSTAVPSDEGSCA